MNDLEIEASLSRIEVVIFDVDGVLTDGKVTIDPDGRESLTFDVQDGLGIFRGYRAGLRYAIISGRESPAVTVRAGQLKIEQVYQGQKNKQEAFDQVLTDLDVEPGQVAFMGDDLNDLPIMRQVGFSCAVANARPEVRASAGMVTHARGGDGAIREFLERIINARGFPE
jgi:3-deoxy-D-manno-octulosonate 8-phosphate phosphatase (KDO 8-P phosphatase)